MALATATLLAESHAIRDTPAFVYDEAALHHLLDGIEPLMRLRGCETLFAIKAFSFLDALRLMAPRIDGFNVSSLFEARLAREVDDGGAIHLTTPGIRPDEADELALLCDAISFNSLSQLQAYRDIVAPHASVGLRVNPQLSFVEDARFDPCRPHSKLGAPLDAVAQALADDSRLLDGVEGVHIHSNCDSTDLSQALDTVRRLDDRLGPALSDMEWVNLGGGYLFEEADSLEPLIEAVTLLRDRRGVRVAIEPGAALVRDAGFIVSTILDVFESEGRRMAVLDTSVNHMQEALEYGYVPEVAGVSSDGGYEHTLVGATCLAGDVFGAYRFPAPLKVGARVVFTEAGAYTLTKAHTFNGVNLPSVYALDRSGRLTLKRRFTYEDYAGRWRAGGAPPSPVQ